MIGPAVFFSFLIPLSFLALIVLVIAALARSRDEPDPYARRPFAVYLLVVMFISLFGTVVSVQQLLSTLVSEAVGTAGGAGSYWAFTVGTGSTTYTSLGSRIFPEVLQALIAGLLAGGVFAFHARKLRDLVTRDESGG